MADSTQDKIQSVLEDLVLKKRIVFWYDEGGQMSVSAEQLNLPGVELLNLNQNPFTIKHRILKGEQPEKGFIVYSADPRPADDDNWLLDLEVEGILFSADMGSLYAAECGIPMELKHKVVDPHLEFFKVSDNRKKLSKRISQSKDWREIIDIMMGVTAKIEPTIDQILLALAKELYEEDSSIFDRFEKYNLTPYFWKEVKQLFGYAKHETIKDLLVVLFQDDLNSVNGQPVLTNAAHIFMRDWRDSRAFGSIYQNWAAQLETELSIPAALDSMPLEDLVSIETFPCVDKIIAAHLQNEVLNGTMTVDQINAVVREREYRVFWSVAEHTLKAMLEARRVIEDVDRLVTGLQINTVEEAFKLYCNELYSIDLHYRHYIREAQLAESKKLIAPVTDLVHRVYTNSYLNELARKWQPLVDAMPKWKFEGITSQRDFYRTHVLPFVEKGRKLFVIISDAMRYETMIELQQRVEGLNRTETTLRPAMVSTLPSYTQLGMAALLPNRHLAYSKNQDEVFVDGLSSKGTAARQNILQQHVPASWAVSAKEFLEVTSPKTAFKDYDLIYIYSNRIDYTGDKRDTEGDVFKATEEEIDQIKRVVELIRNGNGYNILITADHGYIYQNETLDESEFSDFKAEGEVITDTRRFIIGNNLKTGGAVKTWHSDDVGLDAGREIQIAKGMNRMRKQGSGSRFVHGGSMLQEIVIPVLHVNIKKGTNVSQVDVDVLNKRSRITTNQQTISFYQVEPVSEKVTPITLKVGFYDENDNLLSDTRILTFASTSSDSTQREQKHTFIFQNQLSSLNGKEVVLKMERQVPNTDQFSAYKEESYKVSVAFSNEFF